MVDNKVKVAPKKTISIRVSIEEHGELRNISANREASIQSLLYPLVKGWLDSVSPIDKMTPDEEPESDKA